MGNPVEARWQAMRVAATDTLAHATNVKARTPGWEPTDVRVIPR